MIPRPTPKASRTLLALALVSLAGCGGSTPETDTAEVIPAKSATDAPKVETPAPVVTPEPTKDAPKG